jgi:UDP-N-acetylmuramoyl-tripeptide--D-alanyl-D-alanine ligase
LITLQDIQAIPGAKFHNLKFRSAKGISTDSRTVGIREIFFALRGEKFDGHDFVEMALKKGAACAVVDEKWYKENSQIVVKGLPLVVVDNTTHALGDLAKIFRSKFSMHVIAVGGSNGKTTTKEMIAKVLSNKFKVVKTSGNRNNQIGVPLTIFEFRNSHQAAVVEIGTNHFGEIQRLCEILAPNAGIITNIGNEHLEFFGDLEGVKKEEGYLFKYLSMNDGIGFVNVDDKNLASLSPVLKRRFTFGFNKGRKNLYGRIFGMDKKGCALFEVRYGNKTELIHLRVPGIHNAMDAFAAAAVGAYYGIGLNSIKTSLERYTSFNNRMQILKVEGVTILDDTYNSNPESAIAALECLSAIKAKGKKIVVFGDMLELGESSIRSHRMLGREIQNRKFDYLFTYGNLAREIAENSNGELTKESFDDKNILTDRLVETVSDGDVVLVKGSRAMKMEEVVNHLSNELRKRRGD